MVDINTTIRSMYHLHLQSTYACLDSTAFLRKWGRLAYYSILLCSLPRRIKIKKRGMECTASAMFIKADKIMR